MYDLANLNSATKYPSIPTFHALGERGALTEEVTAFTGNVILTEKINGTNGRIIRMPDGDWFIGSREGLLTARGDRVSNPELGIVEALRPLANRLIGNPNATNLIMVYFLETYGGTIGPKARQYTGTGAVDFRMFDLAYVPLDILELPRERIAAWRDAGGQPFANESTLQRAAEAEGIELTARLGTCPAESLPTGIKATLQWLCDTLPVTRGALDELALRAPEGIVLRTPDRSLIAKARYEDYLRTLERQAKADARASLAGSR